MSDKTDSEEDLIARYLAPLTDGEPGAFELKDDAALIAPSPDCDLVVSTDPIVSGVHFFADAAPEDIGWKALAVNVSDLIAKGAEPFAYTMALALPDVPEPQWMAGFAAGLAKAQQAFGCKLIGGDTDRTPGPLSVGITAFGYVPHGRFVPRQGAKPGDHVFVTGTIGDAALGLLLARKSKFGKVSLSSEHAAFLIGRYCRPQPKLSAALLLRAHAVAALDISDGLAKDLAKLTGKAGVSIRTSRVPVSSAARAIVAEEPGAWPLLLGGGDDYEVLIAVAPERLASFVSDAERRGVRVTELAILAREPGVVFLDAADRPIAIDTPGYEHFRQT